MNKNIIIIIIIVIIIITLNEIRSIIISSGTKPVVCEICDRRFGSERHMLSHYNIHNEPRLEEFNVLMRRTKKVRSLPTSFTTVGSFVGVPKALKTYVSEPTFKSFGTKQTFNVSVARNEVKLEDDSEFTYKQDDDKAVKRFMSQCSNEGEELTNIGRLKTKSARRVEFSATSRQYSDVSITSDVIQKVQEAQRQVSPTRSQKSDKLYDRNNERSTSVKLPHVSLEHKVVRGQYSIGAKSNYNKKVPVEEAEENISNTGEKETLWNTRTSTPKSMSTRASFSEAHRQLFSGISANFWDAPGYSKTSLSRRMSGVTSISGYDPFLSREHSPKKSALKSDTLDHLNDFI